MNNWSSPSAVAYTHADIHILRFFGTKLFCGSDGGIYVSSNGGTNFTDLTKTIQNGIIYKLAVAKQTSSKMMTGHQDNGGHAFNANQWKNYYGADGMDVAISPLNQNFRARMAHDCWRKWLPRPRSHQACGALQLEDWRAVHLAGHAHLLGRI